MKKKLRDFPNMTAITPEAVVEKAKVDRMRATEADAVAAFGEHRIERKFRKNGHYSWRIKFQPNEQGKPTRDWGKAWELTQPWAKADVERHAKQYGLPGDYGGGLKGKVTLLGSVNGDFCPECDRLKTWCECPQAQEQGSSPRTAGPAVSEAR